MALVAVRQLDLKVYHRMLRGAVTFGEDFEEKYMKKVFDLDKGMTQVISHYSRHDDAGYEYSGTGRRKYTGKDEITAEVKIRSFYRLTIVFLLVISFLMSAFFSFEKPDFGASENAEVQKEEFNI